MEEKVFEDTPVSKLNIENLLHFKSCPDDVKVSKSNTGLERKIHNQRFRRRVSIDVLILQLLQNVPDLYSWCRTRVREVSFPVS